MFIKRMKSLVAVGLAAASMVAAVPAQAGYVHIWWAGPPYISPPAFWVIYCDSGAVYAFSPGVDPGTTDYTVDYFETGDC